MQQIFSTDNVEQRDRFDCWMDALCTSAVLFDSSPKDEGPFSASIHAAALAETKLGIFEVGDCRTSRGKAEISKVEEDEVFVLLRLRGHARGVFSEREDIQGPGDICMYHTSTTFDQHLVNARMLTWRVPCALLESRIGSVDPRSIGRLRLDAPGARLTAILLRWLPKHCASLDPAAAAHVESSLLDLLTVAHVGEDHSPAATRNHARMAARFRLKSTIETYLFDARLKACDFAEKAGMTARYANMLLATDGTTLERYIFERRLERSRAVLDNPELDFRQVSEIAFSHGFANLAHFSRRFKETYGMTPSEYRVQRPQLH